MIDYFTDPVLRAPTIGSMLMCFAAGIIGVIVFLRKESLVGESLSHASYPGVALGVLAAGAFFEDNPFFLSFGILGGAFTTALLGLFVISFLERRLKVKSDAALCFVLSAFFAVGITVSSRMQFSYSSLFRQIQVYLYGQAATMTDVHILIYGILSAATLLFVLFLYKEILTITLDRDFAKSLGIRVRWIDFLIFILVVLAVVIGIRSVGVVLMSAMLIAPAAFARQFTNKLYQIFMIAGLAGLFSGFMGNYLSLEITEILSARYPEHRIGLPTGPMIVMVASTLSLLALFFAPERGLILRWWRSALFRNKCVKENLLKSLWRFGEGAVVPFKDLIRYQSGSKFYLHSMLRRLIRQGWVERAGGDTFRLTTDGRHRGAHIIRLHRLWEVYLADYMGVGAEKVHYSAEEMEHILTPELERELTKLLHDPKRDPHKQPIPREDNL